MRENSFAHHDSPVLRLYFSDSGFLIFDRQFDLPEQLIVVGLDFSSSYERERERERVFVYREKVE